MTAAVRPTPSAVARIEQAPSIIERKEIAALTTAQARALLEPRLPVGISFERVMSEVYFAIKKDPKLEECTPESLLESVAKAMSTGLIIGEKIYLVPFNVKVKLKDGTERWESRAQAIRDYKGDAELVIRAGGARFIDAHCYYEKEPFEFELGSNPYIKHRPLSSSKRGKLLGAYAVAITSTMLPPKIVVLDYDEIEAVRQRYSKSWKGTDKAPIKLESIPWYAEKTCVHRIVKLLPSTPGLEKIRHELDEEIVVEADDVGNEPITPSASPAGRETESKAGVPHAAPADTDGVSTDVVDAANDHKLPGGPKAWSGQGGKPIGTLSSSHLEKIRTWCVDKLGEAGTELTDAEADPVKVDLVRAIDVVLAHRAKDQTTLPLAGDSLEQQLTKSVAATKPAGSGGPVPMPKPGKIEDALAQGAEGEQRRPPSSPSSTARTSPAASSSTATPSGPSAKRASGTPDSPAKSNGAAGSDGPSFIQLVKQIEQLLGSAERNADEIAEIHEKMAAAKSTTELQAIVTDLSFPV